MVSYCREHIIVILRHCRVHIIVKVTILKEYIAKEGNSIDNNACGFYILRTCSTIHLIVNNGTSKQTYHFKIHSYKRFHRYINVYVISIYYTYSLRAYRPVKGWGQQPVNWIESLRHHCRRWLWSTATGSPPLCYYSGNTTSSCLGLGVH